jgi:hypothetical protein
MNRVLMVGVLFGAWCANAAPVREFIDPETQARVFDATGDQTEFEAPSAPREFENFDAYLKWLALRFEATPVYNDRGEIIDVRGAWILHGRPTYKFEGVEIVVRDPVVQSDRFRRGFVVRPQAWTSCRALIGPTVGHNRTRHSCG